MSTFSHEKNSAMASFLFRPEIVLLGDSITQFSFDAGGWGARLQNQYQRHADVMQRGFSGYNTRWALPLLPLLFPAARVAPALVVVFFGANDAARAAPLRGRGDEASRQHVPLEDYRANLRRIIEAVLLLL